MTDQATTSERTAGGLVGRIVGKVKEATGSLGGNDDLAREGRLQQARVDAEAEAGVKAAEAKRHGAEATLQAAKAEGEDRRQELQNEIASKERERQIGRDRQQAERKAQGEARQQQAAAESQRETQESAAASAEQRAEHERLGAAQKAIELQQQARRAATNAKTIDSGERR